MSLSETNSISVYHYRYCPGHLLYEMLAGWECTTSEPKREQLTKLRNAPVVEVCRESNLHHAAMENTANQHRKALHT